MRGSPSSVSPSVSLPSSPILASRSTLLNRLAAANRSITEAPRRLHFAQDELDHVTHLLASLHLSDAQPPQKVSPLPPPTPLFSNGHICRGDLVRINFPRTHQLDRGIAQFAQGLFIAVRTTDGATVKRYEHNLTLISHASS